MSNSMGYEYGDKVHVFLSGRNGPSRIEEGKVMKVSPSGQVTVDMILDNGSEKYLRTIRFKDGYEIGNRWHGWRIHPKDRQEAEYQASKLWMNGLARRREWDALCSELSQIRPCGPAYLRDPITDARNVIAKLNALLDTEESVQAEAFKEPA